MLFNLLKYAYYYYLICYIKCIKLYHDNHTLV